MLKRSAGHCLLCSGWSKTKRGDRRRGCRGFKPSPRIAAFDEHACGNERVLCEGRKGSFRMRTFYHRRVRWPSPYPMPASSLAMPRKGQLCSAVRICRANPMPVHSICCLDGTWQLSERSRRSANVSPICKASRQHHRCTRVVERESAIESDSAATLFFSAAHPTMRINFECRDDTVLLTAGTWHTQHAHQSHRSLQQHPPAAWA